MSLKDQLISDMKQAMRAGDKVKLDAIRFLRSEIKNYEIDHGQQDQAGLEKLVARQVGQIKESITQYSKGGREDLVQKEKEKLMVMQAYLPAQLGLEELKKIVATTVQSFSPDQVGPAIGKVMQKVQGKADGKIVASLVKEALNA
jgi:uncharacterized protein YqeY